MKFIKLCVHTPQKNSLCYSTQQNSRELAIEEASKEKRGDGPSSKEDITKEWKWFISLFHQDIFDYFSF